MRRSGAPVAVTSVEFDLLQALTRSAGQVVSRESLVRDVLGREFAPQELNSITIAAQAPVSASSQLASFAQRLREVPGVSAVGVPRYVGSDTWELRLGATGDPISSQAQRTIARIRAIPAPASSTWR